MTDTNKILFIVNPFAGISKKKNFPKMVEYHLGSANVSYNIKYTEHSGHATTLAQVGVKDGTDIVVAVGGDGTVNEVAKALVNTSTALGIIPGGSGNGLSMHLGIGRNAHKALSILKNPKFKRIDTCKINDEFFLNMAGTGMDAKVAHRTSQNKHRGFLNYFMDTLRISFFYHNEDYKVELDNAVREGRFLSVNLANGSMFGYNFVVAPQANIQDGYLQLVMMHHAPKWQYFLHSWRFFTRTIHKAPFAEILPTKNVKIQAKNPLYYHLDGDGYAVESNELNAEVLPKSLLVVVPMV